jgi:hypothetical protein
MADTDDLISELESWAAGAAQEEDTLPTEQEEQPCLSQPQIANILRLLERVEGSPLPVSELPPIPR